MNGQPPKSESAIGETTVPGHDADAPFERDFEGHKDGVKDHVTAKGTDEHSNRFLRAPPSGPIRPLSPDTLSQLSTDEFEQLAPRGGYHHGSRIPDRNPRLSAHRPRWRLALEAFWTRNKGLAYMLFAQIFGTLMNVTTRLLEVEGNKGKGLHPFQILFARMGITVVLAMGYMWYKKTPYYPFGMPEVRWLLVARGFGGFFGVCGMYYSLLYLPLADATVITFLAPGISCWICSILIKEPFTRIERIATLVSLVGVVLIARPTSFFGHSDTTPPASGTDDVAPGGGQSGSSDAANYENVTPVQRLTAVGLALVGVCGSVTAFTTIRWIGKRAHPLISVNYFAVWCTIVSFVAQLALPDIGFIFPADLKEWGYLFFLGACGFIMQFLMAAGLAYEKSSRATNMTYTQMLFALSFDKLIFGHSPNWTSILGSSLILGPAIFVAVQQGDGADKEGRQPVGDEESQRGLMSDMEAGEAEADGNQRMPVQEVQMRALR